MYEKKRWPRRQHLQKGATGLMSIDSAKLKILLIRHQEDISITIIFIMKILREHISFTKINKCNDPIY